MPPAALRYQAEQRRLSTLAVRQLRRAGSVAQALPLLAVYQAAAATLALEYGDASLAERGGDTDGLTVVPQAFTVTPGVPSVLDGVDVDARFDLIVAGLVNDAGRSAMGVYTTSRATEYGNIRTLTPPSCSRCAILAGRWYRWSDGFERHPGCDCTMTPAPRSAEVRDPNQAFERGEIGSYRKMPDGSRRFETGLSQREIEAINDGADISQVVNAHRGMQTVNFAGRRVQVTLEGTTSRGLAYRALSTRGTTTRRYVTGARPMNRQVARAPRLSPEAIYRIAGSREEAIRLLRINGYIL